jgi:hypothetical protein
VSRPRFGYYSPVRTCSAGQAPGGKEARKVQRTYIHVLFSGMLRVGHVSVAIRRLVHPYIPHTSAGQEPAGERLSWAGTSWKGTARQGLARKAQLDRDQLYRARQVLDRKRFLMSISICSSLR